jgi:hypothetical protein
MSKPRGGAGKREGIEVNDDKEENSKPAQPGGVACP